MGASSLFALVDRGKRRWSNGKLRISGFALYTLRWKDEVLADRRSTCAPGRTYDGGVCG